MGCLLHPSLPGPVGRSAVALGGVRYLRDNTQAQLTTELAGRHRRLRERNKREEWERVLVLTSAVECQI